MLLAESWFEKKESKVYGNEIKKQTNFMESESFTKMQLKEKKEWFFRIVKSLKDTFQLYFFNGSLICQNIVINELKEQLNNTLNTCYFIIRTEVATSSSYGEDSEGFLRDIETEIFLFKDFKRTLFLIEAEEKIYKECLEQNLVSLKNFFKVFKKKKKYGLQSSRRYFKENECTNELSYESVQSGVEDDFQNKLGFIDDEMNLILLKEFSNYSFLKVRYYFLRHQHQEKIKIVNSWHQQIKDLFEDFDPEKDYRTFCLEYGHKES